MPTEALHELADELEHVHDEDTVDYLDDKLGHPITDPHGAPIPEDFMHLLPGAQVKASLLREGRRGSVTEISSEAAGMGIELGQVLVAGPRSDDGQYWSFFLPDHRKIELNHDEADAVHVRLVEE
jgi:hypothetical protein